MKTTKPTSKAATEAFSSPSQIALAAFAAATAKTVNPVLRAKQERLLRILSGQREAFHPDLAKMDGLRGSRRTAKD